jgi:hypothetical protein
MFFVGAFLSRQNAISAARPQMAGLTNTIDVRTMAVPQCKMLLFDSAFTDAALQAADQRGA